MVRKLLTVFIWVGTIVFNNAYSQNLEGTVDTVSLSEIRISAEVFEGELKTIQGSVSVLTEEQLEQYDELTIVNQLNSLPGIYMQSGTFNTNRIVIRGIGSRTPYSSNRIKAYLNEIPLTNGDGVTTLEDIDVNRIGRIEVMKGPASALYGAGLGGTLKLTSNCLKKLVSVGYQYGSFNSRKMNISSGFEIPQGNISASYHRTHSDGFRENNQYNRNSIFLSSDKQINETKLNFTFMLVDMNAQIPSSINFENFQNSPHKAASNWLDAKGYEESLKMISGITINHRFSENISNKTTLYYSFNNAFEHRPFNDIDDVSKNYGARNQFLFHKNNWDLIAGFELFSEIYSWKIISFSDGIEKIVNDIDENRTYGNLFALLNYQPFERLKLSAGLNLNRLSYEYSGLQNDIGFYRYPLILSPRAGINYRITETIYLYGSLGHGFSSPSLEETLRPDGTKNPDLKQEQGIMEEIGFRFSSYNNRFFVDIVGYQISMNNLLLTKRISEDVFTGINAGKSNHKGVELQTRYVIINKNNFPGMLILNGAITLSSNHFVEFEDDGFEYSGKYLPGIPKYILNAGISWQPNSDFKFHMNYRNVGEQYLTDDNNGKTNKYQLVNSKLSYRLTLKKKLDVNVTGGINNLFNAHYASMVLINAPSFGGNAPRYYYPGQPRNVYIGLRMEF